jgi:uncharacterized surface protein with fasciclin (FAS1) repeats
MRDFFCDTTRETLMKTMRNLKVFGLALVFCAASGVLPPQEKDAEAAQLDIVDTAVSAGSFTTLAKALTEADLIGTLKGAGPYTVFAPTDEAFAKLPADTLEGLLNDKTKLKKVLLYHVVAGAVKAADVIKLSEAKTVQGEIVTIVVGADGVKVNGANVIKTDIEASNGVIHVIDAVIIPKDL